MRLIDADVLQDVLYHEAFETDSDMQRWDSGCWIRYKMFENVLSNIPSADVVERKIGEWLPIIDANELGEPYQCGIYCSECGFQTVTLSNFCPECGSDMRNEE